MSHKYDTGAYVITTFTHHGRKRREWLASNYIQSQSLAMRWKRRTGGSAAVQTTLFNTEQMRSHW